LIRNKQVSLPIFCQPPQFLQLPHVYHAHITMTFFLKEIFIQDTNLFLFLYSRIPSKNLMF
jgi:hypothetical protein